jgi:hypothetical protein
MWEQITECRGRLGFLDVMCLWRTLSRLNRRFEHLLIKSLDT